MSLLTVCNDVCDIIGIERQIAIATGTGGDARQLLSLARRENQELARRTSWQKLTKETTFVSTATVTQEAAIPFDVLFMVNETLFNRTDNHEVFGPVSNREWQMLSAHGLDFAGAECFRVLHNDLQLAPLATAGRTYAFEYVTSMLVWYEDMETERSNYGVDSDVAKLDEELVKLGIIWRWKSLKGLDYAEDYRTYEMQVANSIARDGGKRTISMDAPGRQGAPVVGIPAGNWTP